MRKNIITLFVILMIAFMLTGCIYATPQEPPPPHEEMPPEEPLPEEPHFEEDPHFEDEPPHEEPLPEEQPPHKEPEPDPAPQNEDKSDNPNERIYVEGVVQSVNDDIVIIKKNDGSSYTLRLSENTEWDPSIATWDILIGNYLVVTVAEEGRTQGEVVRISKNGNAG